MRLHVLSELATYRTKHRLCVFSSGHSLWGLSMPWLPTDRKARASLDLGTEAFIETDSTSALDFVNPARIGKLAMAVNPIILLAPQTLQLAMHFKTEKVKVALARESWMGGL